MTVYIQKDANEKLDYVFARYLQENILSVNYSIVGDGSLNVDSCQINPTEMLDQDGNVFPPNRVILLWVSGGTVGATTSVRLEYTTDGGRTLDEKVVFRVVEDD